jgi:hypothetical protein
MRIFQIERPRPAVMMVCYPLDVRLTDIEILIGLILSLTYFPSSYMRVPHVSVPSPQGKVYDLYLPLV